MKFSVLVLVTAIAFSCNSTQENGTFEPMNWEKRKVVLYENDSLIKGSTYLSVYSQIYQIAEHRTYDLTVTVSLRNISSTDTVYVENAKYYNTNGDLIRTYFAQTIYIAPLETVEIVIAEGDTEGGTGANFIFDWATPNSNSEPFFQAVMISTTGQQGLSFTTQGIKR